MTKPYLGNESCVSLKDTCTDCVNEHCKECKETFCMEECKANDLPEVCKTCIIAEELGCETCDLASEVGCDECHACEDICTDCDRVKTCELR
jgi:hypothetical protein